VKVFAALIARWAGYTVAVEASAAGMATAGTVANVAWLPFLGTVGLLVAGFIALNKAIDAAQKKREKVLADAEKNGMSAIDLKNLYGITPERLANLSKIPTQMSAAPKMAKGGVVTRATNVIAGEAGPEAIIPLHKMGMMGGVTIINNIQGSVVTEKEIAVRVRDDLAQLMRRKGLNPSLLGV
jgi:hypothetical protein